MAKLFPLMPDEDRLWRELVLYHKDNPLTGDELVGYRSAMQKKSMQDTEAYLSWLDAKVRAGEMSERMAATAAEEARRYQRERNVRETPDYVPRWLRWLTT